MNKAEILANCIEEIRSGKSTIEECVVRYPAFGKELYSLLEVATSLKPDEVIPSLKFRERAKINLFVEKQTDLTKISHGLWAWTNQVSVRAVVYALVGLFIVVGGGSTTVYAAQSSLPGDTLYPVKTGIENLQLAVTPDATQKANLHLTFAQRRIDEAIQEAAENRVINTKALETVTQQFDNAISVIYNSEDTEAKNILSQMSTKTLNQQLELEHALTNANQQNQVALGQALNVARRGNTLAEVAYNNHDFLNSRPSVTDEQLDTGQFNLDGTLVSIQDNVWNIGGTVLHNVRFSGSIPPLGSRVSIEGLVKNNSVFISQIKASDDSQKPTTMEGQYRGTDANGKSDVGGISVTIADGSKEQLQPGDTVHLQGQTDNGKLSIVGKENRQNDNSSTTTIKGVLTAVDLAHGTVIVWMTGNEIKINVNEARSGTGNQNILASLSRSIGKDVTLSGLYKHNGLLYASQVQIQPDD